MQIKIKSETYEVKRFGLRKWLELEEVKLNIQRAIQRKDRLEIANQVFSYVSMALDISVNMTDCPYQEIVEAYTDITYLNRLNVDLPFMQVKSKKVDKPLPYDYPNRTWWLWAHQFSHDFGWLLEYIAGIDPDDAACLYQESLISDYFKQEWEWMCSENSVGYDEASKKSKYNELPKPVWMQPKIEPPKKVKMLKSMLPSGIIQKMPDAKSS